MSAGFVSYLQGVTMINLPKVMEQFFIAEQNFNKFNRDVFLNVCGSLDYEKVCIDPESIVVYLSNVDLETRVMRDSHLHWLNSAILLETKISEIRKKEDLKSEVDQLKTKVIGTSLIPSISFSMSRIRRMNCQLLFEDNVIKTPVNLVEIASKFEGSDMEGTRFVRAFSAHMLTNLYGSEAVHLAATKSVKYQAIGNAILLKLKDLLFVAIGSTPSIEIAHHIERHVKDSAVRYFDNARKKKGSSGPLAQKRRRDDEDDDLQMEPFEIPTIRDLTLEAAVEQPAFVVSNAATSSAQEEHVIHEGPTGSENPQSPQLLLIGEMKNQQ